MNCALFIFDFCVSWPTAISIGLIVAIIIILTISRSNSITDSQGSMPYSYKQAPVKQSDSGSQPVISLSEPKEKPAPPPTPTLPAIITVEPYEFLDKKVRIVITWNDQDDTWEFVEIWNFLDKAVNIAFLDQEADGDSLLPDLIEVDPGSRTKIGSLMLPSNFTINVYVGDDEGEEEEIARP